MYERASLRLRLKRLGASWHAWWQFTERKGLRTRQVQSACLHFRQRKMHEVLSLWHNCAAECRMERVAAVQFSGSVKRQVLITWKASAQVQKGSKMLLQRVSARHVARSFSAWLGVVQEVAHEKKCMQLAVEAHERITIAKALATWLWRCQELKAKRERLQIAVHHMHAVTLSRLWRVWVQRASWLWCKRQQHSTAAVWLRSKTLKRATTAWVHATHRASVKRVMLHTATQKCRKSYLVSLSARIRMGFVNCIELPSVARSVVWLWASTAVQVAVLRYDITT